MPHDVWSLFENNFFWPNYSEGLQRALGEAPPPPPPSPPPPPDRDPLQPFELGVRRFRYEDKNVADEQRLMAEMARNVARYSAMRRHVPILGVREIPEGYVLVVRLEHPEALLKRYETLTERDLLQTNSPAAAWSDECAQVGRYEYFLNSIPNSAPDFHDLKMGLLRVADRLHTQLGALSEHRQRALLRRPLY